MLRKKRRRVSPEEKFILSGTSQTSFIPNSRLIRKLFQAIPVLRIRNCRLYFSGQLISHIGSWMQVTALAWLTLQVTNSAFMVGLAAAMSALPALFFSLFGGVIVDNFSKKSILLLTNFLAMILAFVLGLLVIFGRINVLEIMIISLLGGIINAVFTPAHFSYLSELADKDTLPSAMSINMGVSSLSRILGPAIAGVFIVIAGSGGAFILNGFSYIAVIAALLMINSPHKVINQHLNPILAIKEGLLYSVKNPMIRLTFTYVAAMSIFAWSYTTIIPVMAKNVFHSDATGMGYLFSAVGIGAIFATIVVSALAKRFSKLTFILFGNTLFAISLFLFSFTSNLYLGLFYLFLTGAGLVALNVVLGTMIQLMAEEKYRGRVTSIYFLVYAGLMFLGNLEIGFLTDFLGAGTALRVNTFVVLFIGIYIYLVRSQVRSHQKRYNAGH